MKETINGQERRKEILQFIEKYIEEHNYPPSVREITVASGLKSSATTFHHLQKMKEEGIIESDNSDGDAKSSSRAIRIPGWKMKKDGSEMTFYSIYHIGDTWETLAAIDYLKEEGYIKIISNEGYTQDRRYVYNGQQ